MIPAIFRFCRATLVRNMLSLCGPYSARTTPCFPDEKVTGNDGQVGILNGATLVNSASGSMEWLAPSTVGWGGTFRNMGDLTFSGTAVSLKAAEDEVGFFVDNSGPWPTLVNEEGAQVVVEGGAGIVLEWLLWNEGGSVVVRRRWIDQEGSCRDS